ncbi:MAG: nucleotidyltransferase family protein [Bacteroidota bacterium]
MQLDKKSSERLAEVCTRYHVRKLSIFGSVIRGEDQSGSDLDVLVEFEPGRTPGFSFISLQDELSAIFGRNVDLNTPGDLSKYFRESAVRESHQIYAATQP